MKQPGEEEEKKIDQSYSNVMLFTAHTSDILDKVGSHKQNQ